MSIQSNDIFVFKHAQCLSVLLLVEIFLSSNLALFGFCDQEIEQVAVFQAVPLDFISVFRLSNNSK